MERRILTPENIITPYEYQVGNQSILNIYFRIFERGHGDDLPPVIIVDPNDFREKDLLQRWFLKDAEEFYQQLKELEEKEGKPYYLLDGNHRAVAATLCHQPLNVLEINGDEDLETLKRLENEGKLFNLPNWPTKYAENQVQTKIGSMILRFEELYLRREVINLKQRVDKLIANGEFPEYMAARYFKERNDYLPLKSDK